MPKINVLSKNVAELIAAGEVIERPSSVIKELVENSIDSGANNITVEIQNGGISFMRVTDNGCGISQEDVPSAFLRHATSKVLSEDDLNNISTMGFRGEALASISAVAKVEMLSKQENDKFGFSYKIEGGTEVSAIETGCPDGTTILIKDLFYNTPARLKFLKRDVSEGNSIASIVDKLALAHPEISFRFIRDNKPIRITPGDGSLYSAVYSVFGKQFATSLIPVEYNSNNINISGYVSSPLFPRSNRTMQYFYVNSRYIKSTSCTAAVEEGCRNNMMTGKFPACVINIEIDPFEIDVNVHPAKTEVRFSNDRVVFDAVYFAIKNAVLNADNNKTIEPPKPIYTPQKAINQEVRQDTLNSFVTEYDTQKSKKSFNAIDITPKSIKYEQRVVLLDKDIDVLGIKNNEQKETNNDVIVRKQKTQEQSDKDTDKNIYNFINENNTKKVNKKTFSSSSQKKDNHLNIHKENSENNSLKVAIPSENEENPLKIIGELWKTYIMCENSEQFILIDKHAAHERLRFEKLKKEFVSTSQLLAESIFIEIDNSKRDILINYKELLLNIGIEVLEAENYKIEITSIPTVLIGSDIEAIINVIIDILINGGSDTSAIFDDLLHGIACKSAIKANDISDLNDLKNLANEVWKNKNIRFCPHGRPIITVMSKTEIEKNFKRII